MNYSNSLLFYSALKTQGQKIDDDDILLAKN